MSTFSSSAMHTAIVLYVYSISRMVLITSLHLNTLHLRRMGKISATTYLIEELTFRKAKTSCITVSWIALGFIMLSFYTAHPL